MGAALACNLLLLSLFVSSSARSVFVSPEAGLPNTTTFYQAVLNPQVTDIVLTSSYNLGDEFSQYKASPLQVNRNVTVTGLHGTDDVLDLQFALSKVELCPTCTWTWQDITVANERRGGGPAWDFFVGPAGGAGFPVNGRALVVGDNMVRLRLACAAARYTKDIIHTNQRPAVVNATKGQNYTVTTVSFQGHDYPDTLVLYDHGAVVPRMIQEGRGVTGGYGVWDHNVTRLCLDTVGDDCLAIRSPEACVNDRIDRALAEQAAAAAAAGTLSAGALAAAIFVPTFSALALLAVLGIVWRRCWRRRRLHQPQRSISDGTLLSQLPHCADGGNPVHKWLDAGGGQGDAPETTPSDYQGPMASRRGWELTNSLTNPLIGDVEDGRIIFSDLLGTGSFGRVYKGAWAGRTVAIKVIEYDASSRSEVENEVQLMLSFNHPNIVHAYHCVTYTCTGGTTGSGTKFSDCVATGANNSNNHNSHKASSSATTMPQLRVSTDGSTSALLPVSQQQLGLQQHGPQARGHEPAAKRGSARDLSILRESTDRGTDSSTTQQQQADGGDAGGQTAKDQECWTIAERQEKDGWQVQSLGVVVGSARVETWLVQEYCDCGTLGSVANRLRESGTADSMLKLVLLLLDVANGLKVLHSRSTVHGDLNARDVLVASAPLSTHGCAAKLADLGLSRVMAKHRTHRTTDTVGTMSHMPPELLRHGKQSPAGDIYAFGIMMWELYTGRQAFKDLHYGQFFEEIVLNSVRPPLPQGMPADYLLLMHHCWAADPADRPSVDRLLQCIQFMLQERQRSTGSSRRSSAVLPATPQSASTQTSSAGTSTPGKPQGAGGFFN